jgi:hypothetical protein
VVEEADVVVLLLQRLDRRGDETVELGEIRNEIGGQGKIQGEAPDVPVLVIAAAIKVTSSRRVKQSGEACRTAVTCVFE